MTDHVNNSPPQHPEVSGGAPSSDLPAKKGLSPRATLLILGVALLFVLMPYLFWQASWFGRPLSDDQLTRYLGDTQHARNAQHGLVQLSERIDHHAPGVSRWYPQVVALGSNPETQVRLTAAWVMGHDAASQEFHRALLALLADSDPMVRGNAALSLVRFGDDAGLSQIRAMLEPAVVTAPFAGAINTRLKAADVVRAGTLLAHIVTAPGNVSAGNSLTENGAAGNGSPRDGSKGNVAGGKSASERLEVRSALPGRVERWLVADGSTVSAGQPLLELSPSPDVAWEALRALYLIGQPGDIPVVQKFTRASTDMPPGIAQQAALTLQAIRSRADS